ncbi:hypothetical protein [Fluviispira multicolorata]|uniref:Uncharacterized protein n=1 Tax=Fluviispira multicolorata TaxID=2654512 RepID=A0A833JC95_9BACT|nr:hypothetical protein [Fluviispira multicolorata]KAB8030613.1 hypothetical protein GCL57_06465 [Fluviispira multicolorata]
MFKKFLKKLFGFLFVGLIWLFIFSIPVGEGKRLYNICYTYIVDTRPVRWVKEKISSGAKTTENTAKDTASEVIDKVGKEVKK